MGYATVFHVEALNTGRSIGTSTHPNATQCVQFLEETAGVLDGLLRANGYETPVPTSASAAHATIENFNALGAHYYVEQAAKSSDRIDSAKAMWESALKMLGDGTIELDAPKDTTIQFPRSNFGPDGSCPTPFFTRGMQF